MGRTMTAKTLKLPSNVQHLIRELNGHPSLLNILEETQTKVGGGSVLAAHWKGHRRSTDVDLMMPEEGFLWKQREIWEALKNIPAKRHRAETDGTGFEIVMMSAARVRGVEGDIEIVRDVLGDDMRREQNVPEGPHVEGLPLASEAKTYILAKKFDRMRRADLERDHYDVLWAALYDSRTLVEAMERHVPRRVVHQIALRAQQPAEVLFADQKKPVRDPKIADWKDMLPEVWRVIDDATGSGEKSKIDLRRVKRVDRKKGSTYYGE